ncbi:GtrA family protein [Azohydromonas aeria]|uniref:GtrA family protein n=1 Tax=Azohydromonas aeria TaxID=2590212 RepID=UPI0012F9EF0F|nr:GtrA family protein [Azohydromonas aeria]
MHKQFLIFVLVGGIATGLQYAVLLALMMIWDFPPTLASSVGFLASLFLNYAMNRSLTFLSRQRHAAVFPRFLMVSLGGLLLNGLALSLLLRLFALPVLAAQAGSTAMVLMWNYWAHRAWTFRTGSV